MEEAVLHRGAHAGGTEGMMGGKRPRVRLDCPRPPACSQEAPIGEEKGGVRKTIELK